MLQVGKERRIATHALYSFLPTPPQDAVDHRNVFVSQMISTIMHKLELKAGLKYQVWGKALPATIHGTCAPRMLYCPHL